MPAAKTTVSNNQVALDFLRLGAMSVGAALLFAAVASAVVILLGGAA